MMNNLIPVEELKDLSVSEEYIPMLALIKEHRPSALISISNIGKSHTQFQSTMLDNTAPLGGLAFMRNRRQALSDIFHTESAIKTSVFKKKKSLCRIALFREKARLKREIDANGQSYSFELEAQILDIKAEKLESELKDGDVYLLGALRKLARRYEQLHALEVQIKKQLEKDSEYQITEQDEEEEEPKHHIIMAFSQALCAARSRGNVEDTVNFIYFQNLGIPSCMAQLDIEAFLKECETKLRAHSAIGNEVVPEEFNSWECKFLRDMYSKYKKCPAAFAKERGLLPDMSKITTLGYVEKSNGAV